MRIKIPPCRFKEESGQAVVWFAMTVAVMLMFGALVIDFGRPALEARRLQNAADSAALAAAYKLPLATSSSQNEILGAAREYAAKNGFPDPAQTSISLGSESSGKYLKVTTTVSSTVDYTLAKLMGFDSIDLSRSASVKISPVSGISHAVPIAIKRDKFEANLAAGEYNMQLKYGGGEGSGGDYGAIDPDDAGGANLYRTRLENDYEGYLNVGDLISVEHGNMSGPTGSAIAVRFYNCHHSPACTPTRYVKGCPRIMKVPIVHWEGSKLKIDGFAPFILTSGEVGSGNDCKIFARYIPGYVVDDAEGGDADSTASDYGMYVKEIVE